MRHRIFVYRDVYRAKKEIRSPGGRPVIVHFYSLHYLLNFKSVVIFHKPK